MAEQSRLDVSKWDTARPRWVYTPALWFYYRMIEVALLDAWTTQDGKPSDEGLLARDWIARSRPAAPGACQFVSFPECCAALSLDAEKERPALLEAIDRAVDMDTDEAWARLEELGAREPADDTEPLFDAPRTVPALDQMTLLPPPEVCDGMPAVSL